MRPLAITVLPRHSTTFAWGFFAFVGLLAYPVVRIVVGVRYVENGVVGFVVVDFVHDRPEPFGEALDEARFGESVRSKGCAGRRV